MGTQYNIHPDFRMLSSIHTPLNDRSISKIQKLMGPLYHQQRSGSAVKVERIKIPDEDRLYEEGIQWNRCLRRKI